MARSKRYRQLAKELGELRRHMLPQQFSATGSYAARITSRAGAFRVLAHAEIEAYLEDRALDVVRHALRKWEREGYIGRTVLCLIAFAGRNMDQPPPTLIPDQPNKTDVWDSKLRLTKKLNDASTVFHAVVRNNNGIRESNILRLLLPIGIDVDDLDPVWISSMNSYGEIRGQFAHTSRSSWKTSQPPDPETELRAAQQALDGLLKVDSILNGLMI